MRVAYFSRDYTPHDHRFLSALAETDHEVHYLRLEDAGKGLENRRLPVGIHTIDWWGGRHKLASTDWPRAAMEVRSELQRLRPDLVHAGPIHSAALLSALAGFHPLLSMSWGSDLLQGARSGIGALSARWTLKRSEAFATDSQTVAQRAFELGAKRQSTFIFPWGVDLQRFSPGVDSSVRQRLGWSETDFVLVSTRSWEPLYGLREVARAFAAIAGAEPSLRLLLLGSGRLEGELVETFEQAEVLSQVVFPGQIANDALPGFYRAADLYLSASHSDGSSVSLMEALACGLPALVSDIPSNLEWVTAGQNGWTFNQGSASDLERCIGAAMAAKDDLIRMGKRSRYLAEQRADWKHNFSVLLEAYQYAAGGQA